MIASHATIRCVVYRACKWIHELNAPRTWREILAPDVPNPIIAHAMCESDRSNILFPMQMWTIKSKEYDKVS